MVSRGATCFWLYNLRKHYPHYTEDIFREVSDEVYEVILLSIRQENNYKSRMYYHKAQYSLDCDDGIENDAHHRMPSPEEILMEKVSMEQLYKAIKALPPLQGKRVYDRYINQKKNVEIARAEGVHETSTRQSVIKAIENLRKYYAKNGWLL